MRTMYWLLLGKVRLLPDRELTTARDWISEPRDET